MIRENLSNHIPCEQFALQTFEYGSALVEKDQMAFGTLPQKMNRPEFHITNMKLYSRHRWVEFLRMMNQMTIEFNGSSDISQLFQRMGVDTRTGDIWEMYMAKDSLLCDYCIQVNLDKDSPWFVKVKAYAKDR